MGSGTVMAAYETLADLCEFLPSSRSLSHRAASGLTGTRYFPAAEYGLDVAVQAQSCS